MQMIDLYKENRLTRVVNRRLTLVNWRLTSVNLKLTKKLTYKIYILLYISYTYIFS